MLHTVWLVGFMALPVLTVLQEGDLLQHPAPQALFAIFAYHIPLGLLLHLFYQQQLAAAEPPGPAWTCDPLAWALWPP